MIQTMPAEERIRVLHDRAVRELVAAHATRQDEPLVLAVRYRTDEPADVYLLEALDGFPGGDDDELLVTEFEPSPQLRILGTLHLALGSPGQLRAAIARGDAIVADVKRGAVVFDSQSAEARDLRQRLGL
jgi:hypothetical protein